MDLLNMIMNASGGDGVRRLAQNFGLDENQTTSAVTSLLPALGQGLARNASTPGGMEALMGAISSGRHERYIDSPDSLAVPDTVQDGNGILGHVLGSKDISRQVASNAAAQTGIGAEVLKKMLPVVAAMAMGALSKQRPRAGPQQLGGSPEPDGLMGMLGQFLAPNQGCGGGTDILGIASKLLR